VRSLQSDSTDASVFAANEQALEDIIAARPELLGIGSDTDPSHISGRFVVFSQSQLPAFNGRTIIPDLILLWESGHVTVVEVKLAGNEELRDRRVVAQLLEYAACLSQCGESRLLEMFRGDRNATSWGELVAKLFPDARQPGRLAQQLLDEFRLSRLHLIIACDEAPAGLKSLVRGVIGQSALGEYSFRVVELMTFSSARPEDGIMFLPHTVLETEIVARTSISVNVPSGSSAPEVTVTVTSLEDQEEAVRETKERAGSKRVSTEQSFFESAQENALSTSMLGALRKAFDSATDRGWKIRPSEGSSGEESFNLIIPSVSRGAIVSLYNDGQMMINLGNIPQDIGKDFRGFLSQLTGVGFTAAAQYPKIRPAGAWVPHIDAIIHRLDTYESGADGQGKHQSLSRFGTG
jgi:hypothetical protein